MKWLMDIANELDELKSVFSYVILFLDHEGRTRDDMMCFRVDVHEP